MIKFLAIISGAILGTAIGSILIIIIIAAMTIKAEAAIPTPIIDLVIGDDEALLSWGDSNCNTTAFRVYYGNAPGIYNDVILVEPVFSNGRYHYLFENLPDGVWFFVVTATNIFVLESEYSNEVSKIINTQTYECTNCHSGNYKETEK